MLTEEKNKLLCAFFAAEDHEFKDGSAGRKLAYLREDDIAARLDAVDLGWTWQTESLYRVGDQAVVLGRLTVCGVTRSGTGMQTINANDKGRESGEAEKGATTDAFKRAARLFGVGRYLVGLPHSVKDEKSLKDWMTAQAKPAQNQNKVVHQNADARRVPTETEQAELAIADMTPAGAGKQACIEWFRGVQDAYQVSSKDALAILGITQLSEWVLTLGQAENAIKTRLELDRAHTQNQAQPASTQILYTDPTSEYWVKEIQNGKNKGKSYLSIAGVAFFDGDGEILRQAGFDTDAMRGESKGKHDLGVTLRVGYIEEAGSGGKTNKKPLLIEEVV